MRRGKTGERRRVLGIVAEVVGETEFGCYLNDLRDPAGRQQALHGGGFGGCCLIRWHFHLPVWRGSLGAGWHRLRSLTNRMWNGCRAPALTGGFGISRVLGSRTCRRADRPPSR